MRLSPGKQLDAVFTDVEQYLTAHADAGYVMGGFDDGAESQRLRANIARFAGGGALPAPADADSQ